MALSYYGTIHRGRRLDPGEASIGCMRSGAN
jgi:hypothetical protein